MADSAFSAPALKFHPFVIRGKAGEFPATQADRLALYAAAAAAEVRQ